MADFVRRTAVWESKHSVEIFFLPNIKDFAGYPENADDDLDSRPPEQNEICKKLSRNYYVDPWFLTQSAVESNGFFRSVENPIKDQEFKGTSHSTYSRFLLKRRVRTRNLQQQHEDKFDWEYISFYTLWFAEHNGTGRTILLCFDDARILRDDILRSFETHLVDHGCCSCPFAVTHILVQPVTFRFDVALWSYRRPVRDIEKGRGEFANQIASVRPVASEKSLQSLLVEKYTTMHDLSRHVIHICESLGVAAQVLETLIDSIKSCNHVTLAAEQTGEDPAEHRTEMVREMRFFVEFLAALNLRAKAFRERIENEIQLAYSIVNAIQLEESRHDGRDLSRLVTFLTLFFLPGTFVAGFFGMNFFDFETEESFKTSRKIWIFFVVTVPITLVALSIWFGIHYLGWEPSKHLKSWSGSFQKRHSEARKARKKKKELLSRV